MDLFWWGVTAVCALSALPFLCNTIIITFKVKKNPSLIFHKASLNRINFILWFHWLVFSMWAAWKIPYNFDMNQIFTFFRPLQLNICLALWLSTSFCAIIRTKVISKKSWREFMDDCINEFIDFFKHVREFLLAVENQLYVRNPWLLKALFVIWFVLSAILLKIFPKSNAVIAIISISFLCCILLVMVCKALHSCRILLMYWMVYDLLLATGGSSFIHFPGNTALQNAVSYMVFLILYAILWLLLAGAADAEPTKMACKVINTLTTLLLIHVNVLAVWGKSSDIPGLNLFPWGELQDFSVVLLLPLVVNGYLAALLKELQDYWSRKKKKEQRKAPTQKKIGAFRVIDRFSYKR
jgi:hypothetical protein